MRSVNIQALAFSVLFLLAGKSLGQSYTGINVGGDTGSTQTATGGHDLRSSGRDIGGNSDQFHFAYQQRTGDFDVKVRVADVTITDAFVQAGLVARGALDANAPFAGVFSSSAQISAFFEHRQNSGGNAAIIAPPLEFSANYPQMFLRLRRVGNTFTGYGSLDGQSWQVLGSATVSLPSSVFFGMGLASHDTNKVSTAKFRELGNVTGAGTLALRGEREPLGPSNRRTGLVFSEIMYNPAPSADTNNLEFIEVYNGENIFVDLTGWKITGGVE